jgi:hypothetical protein
MFQSLEHIRLMTQLADSAHLTVCAFSEKCEHTGRMLGKSCLSVTTWIDFRNCAELSHAYVKRSSSLINKNVGEGEYNA